jgi:hypothetical protein
VGFDAIALLLAVPAGVRSGSTIVRVTVLLSFFVAT